MPDKVTLSKQRTEGIMFKRLFASRKNPYIPGLNNPEHIILNIGGCRLEMDIPPHYDSAAYEKEPTDVPNIYDASLYESNSDSHFYNPNGAFLFNGLLPISRYWEFLGPFWYDQYLGLTKFLVSVLRVDCLTEGMSCLNPDHFEQVILRFLFDKGPDSPDLIKKIAPVNWQIKEIGHQPWVLFEQREDDPNQDITGANFHSYAATAIDDRYFLLVYFINFGYTPSELSIANMNAFKDRIMDSVRWQLSDAAQKRLQEVKTQWPDAKLSQHRKPEDWVYPEWRRGDKQKGEPNIVILKRNTPPPEFKI